MACGLSNPLLSTSNGNAHRSVISIRHSTSSSVIWNILTAWEWILLLFLLLLLLHQRPVSTAFPFPLLVGAALIFQHGLLTKMTQKECFYMKLSTINIVGLVTLLQSYMLISLTVFVWKLWELKNVLGIFVSHTSTHPSSSSLRSIQIWQSI